MKSVIPGEARDFIEGPHYQQWLYMAGFFAFFLSYFVLPDYPSDSPSPAVFPLAVLLARGEPTGSPILGVFAPPIGPGSH